MHYIELHVKVIGKIPKNMEDETLIISCEEDKTDLKNALESGYVVHTAEILLTGILRQELDLNQYPFHV